MAAAHGSEQWLGQWPALMPTLAGGLDSGDASAIDGCLDCLLKLSEEDGVASRRRDCHFVTLSLHRY